MPSCFLLTEMFEQMKQTFLVIARYVGLFSFNPTSLKVEFLPSYD